MAEAIQFHCPACATVLRLPLAMSGSRGACPACSKEIIAPDVFRGIAASEVPELVVPPPPPAFQPFAEHPPITREPEPEPEPEPEIPEPTPEPNRAPEHRSIPAAPPVVACCGPGKAVLVLSCALTGTLALAAGYFLGLRSQGGTPPVAVIPKIEAPVVIAPPPAPVPLVVKPRIESPEKPEPPRATAGAEASLRAFLEAPDWATRAAHVLFPEKLRAAMEAYSREAPDGPTRYKSITVQHSETDPETGRTLFIFQVKTPEQPMGIPVAVAETPIGWLVDWETFVEFRDDRFKKFTDGPAGMTGRFHLIVGGPLESANENFETYSLDPPISGRRQAAFVRKDSPARAKIQQATTTGALFTPVLEVAKRSTADGQSYLEILDVIATDWRPYPL